MVLLVVRLQGEAAELASCSQQKRSALKTSSSLQGTDSLPGVMSDNHAV